MRIAILNQHRLDVLGGSEIQCDLIASGLARRGHEVVYLAAQAQREVYDTEYPTVPLRSFGFFRVLRILRALRPEILYWRHNKKGLLVSALAAKLLGIKFVYSMSNINDSRFWTRSTRAAGNLDAALRKTPRQLLRLLKFSLQEAVNFLAVPLLVDGAVSLNRSLIDAVPVKRKTVIHNSMVAEATAFSWHRPYVVWVANVKEKKNPDQYRALAGALEDMDADFLMVGRIVDSHYAGLADAALSGANFHFLGPKSPSEVNGILKASLAMIHTCDPEGFGNNFIQAWLQGKPAVSLFFDPEGILEHENIGLFSRDFPRFVRDVRNMIGDRGLREQMGERALLFARREFDPEANIPKLDVFLKSVVEA